MDGKSISDVGDSRSSLLAGPTDCDFKVAHVLSKHLYDIGNLFGGSGREVACRFELALYLREVRLGDLLISIASW